MGYNTYYQIEFDSEEHDAFTEALERTEYGDWLDYYNGQWSGEFKWYDHQDDLIGLSKEFPSTLITVTGSGEDSGDYWRKYFFNGKVQVEQVPKFPPFDPAKLK